MPKRMSKEARLKISEGMKRRYRLMKEANHREEEEEAEYLGDSEGWKVTPPAPYGNPKKKAMEFKGTFEPETGTLTLTLVLDRYASILNTVLEATRKLQ